MDNFLKEISREEFLANVDGDCNKVGDNINKLENFLGRDESALITKSWMIRRRIPRCSHVAKSYCLTKGSDIGISYFLNEFDFFRVGDGVDFGMTLNASGLVYVPTPLLRPTQRNFCDIQDYHIKMRQDVIGGGKFSEDKFSSYSDGDSRLPLMVSYGQDDIRKFLDMVCYTGESYGEHDFLGKVLASYRRVEKEGKPLIWMGGKSFN